ncbi:hypothetical protein CRG98_032421 [Punica granatum]|uniref:CG-1 domain-containing protein n=1 Tax=Punica granatum TaxID=22663 RepID=A0A2I0IT65_PUNGR|nr:hypothetical protein CRG98_032421 [Punica granatum]
MAETRRYLPAQNLDLAQILQEAQCRWLRPAEICEILRNYQKFSLTPEPPTRPPAGSLFLFDRKALRYFRKDGHRWRKKKDGKTVKEAHEKLKAGSVDVLHCYYAHGEDNECFQRRSYWMLDGQLEHIVLVHYREVKEGYKSSISRFLADRGSQDGGPQTSSVTCFPLANYPVSTPQTSYSTANKPEQSGQTVSAKIEDVDSVGTLGPFTLATPVYHPSQRASFLASENAGFPAPRNPTQPWFAGGSDKVSAGPVLAEVHRSDANDTHDQEFYVGHKFYAGETSAADFLNNKLAGAGLEADCTALEIAGGNRLFTDSDLQVVEAASHGVALGNGPMQNRAPVVASSGAQVESKSNVGDGNNEELGSLRKLDSFGRWMDKEIGRDCDDSLMASDSGNYWNALTDENDDKEVSSLSRHMQLDTDSLAPSLSQEQLFSISDFSPDWAYSGIETKVLIVGTFLPSKDLTVKPKWGCMFGEIEVPAEILTDTSMRCIAPSHAPGRVPFYITCSNRLACSEVREFEYRERPSTAIPIDPYEESRLQIRLAKLLHLSEEDQLFDCPAEKCDKCELKKAIYPMKVIGEGDTGREVCKLDHGYPIDAALQSLFRDRLGQWLLCKVHEGGKALHVLDEEGQGVIHLAAALGYEWAIGPIIAAGVTPNFRDARGRTGLHWASYFGREETVIALIELGADPGLVDDPTPAFPAGQTAADLASSRGHKGIAGYLAEADLTSRLSKLNVSYNVMDAVNLASEKVIETASQVVSSSGTRDEELSLKGSLAAVRKSAHAAALIQASFRARSFRQRQLTKGPNVVSEVLTDLIALGSLNKVQKVGHFEDYLHSAAIRIQQKYRGWKGRKEFLKIRNRIVKVQAHVRGHQVRKQYKKVVWSVSIVEKAILRWRRKRVGLRAFRLDNSKDGAQVETEKTDEYDFLRIGRKQKFDGVERALARVKSMVRDPRARGQYMRMVSKFDSCKMDNDGNSAS